MPRLKGFWPAVTQTEVVGAHRLRLYVLYDRDAKALAWVDDLYTRYWPTLAATLRRYPEFLPDSADAIARAMGTPDGETVVEYLSALRREARRFGLDRIPRVGPAPSQRPTNGAASLRCTPCSGTSTSIGCGRRLPRPTIGLMSP